MANKYKKREHGSVYIEAAVVLPIFFALIFGIIDMSRVMWADANITNALADAARSAEVLDLSDTANREVVANVFINSLRRYKTSITSLHCKQDDEHPNCPALANFRMQWFDRIGYQEINASRTVRDEFYPGSNDDFPRFDNSAFASGTFKRPVNPQGKRRESDGKIVDVDGNNSLGDNRQNTLIVPGIGLSVMFRPECRICKFLLGRELLYRRVAIVPYSGGVNDPFSLVNNCADHMRACLINLQTGALATDPNGGGVCSTCVNNSEYNG